MDPLERKAEETAAAVNFEGSYGGRRVKREGSGFAGESKEVATSWRRTWGRAGRGERGCSGGESEARAGSE
jgi:hypothetical protein